MNKGLAHLSPEKKKELIESLSYSELKALYKMPELFLMDYQKVPKGNWRYFLFCAGRSSGKSFSGTNWLYSKYLEGAKSMAMVGPDYNSVVNHLLPTFLSWFPPDEKPVYNSQKQIVTCKNGAIVYIYTSQTEIRGPNLEYCLIDEICKFCDSIEEKIEERFKILDLAVRIGKQPQIYISSTPKPMNWFFNFAKQIENNNPIYAWKTASTKDNSYLPESFLHAMHDQYANTRLGQQELDGVILIDIEGALWSNKLIDDNRISPKDFQDLVNNPFKFHIQRTVIALDPSGSSGDNSDEAGIIVAHLGSDNHIYVVQDFSKIMSPEQWATTAINAFKKYKADRIVYEKNYGGQMVERTLRSISPHIPLKSVWAKKGKILRAEPVASLYERNLVHHVGLFPQLEREMVTFNGDPKQKSPNRLDSLVYSATELLLESTYVHRSVENVMIY